MNKNIYKLLTFLKKKIKFSKISIISVLYLENISKYINKKFKSSWIISHFFYIKYIVVTG